MLLKRPPRITSKTMATRKVCLILSAIPVVIGITGSN